MNGVAHTVEKIMSLKFMAQSSTRYTFIAVNAMASG